MEEKHYAEIAGKAYYLKGDMEWVFLYNKDGVYSRHWIPYEKLDASKFVTVFGGMVPIGRVEFEDFLKSLKFGHDLTNFKGEATKLKGTLLFPKGVK